MFHYAVRGAAGSAPATAAGSRSSTARSSPRPAACGKGWALPHPGRHALAWRVRGQSRRRGRDAHSGSRQYSTAAFPISVDDDTVSISEGADPRRTPFTIDYHSTRRRRPARGRWSSTAPTPTGKSFSVVSRWLATGRGRADATVTGGTAGTGPGRSAGTTRSCRPTTYKPWDPQHRTAAIAIELS